MPLTWAAAVVASSCSAVTGWALGRRRRQHSEAPAPEVCAALDVGVQSTVEFVRWALQRERRLEHDLRSALTGVVGQLSLAETSSSKIFEHVQRASTAAQHLAERLGATSWEPRWSLRTEPSELADLGAAIDARFPSMVTADGACMVTREMAACVVMALVVVEPCAVRLRCTARSVEADIGPTDVTSRRAVEWLASGIGTSVTWTDERLMLQMPPTS